MLNRRFDSERASEKSMLDAEHYKRCLDEQLGVLLAHQSESQETDYAFIRDHAQAIVQICDQAELLRTPQTHAVVQG